MKVKQTTCKMEKGEVKVSEKQRASERMIQQEQETLAKQYKMVEKCLQDAINLEHNDHHDLSQKEKDEKTAAIHFQIGSCLFHGFLLPQDVKKSIEFFELASNLNHPSCRRKTAKEEESPWGKQYSIIV